ncbi:MAG: nicotinate-nucleotide adenylyltransferase [Chromatiales bacterium]|jgi:nicotinate-nucleotide adenylyltransferase
MIGVLGGTFDPIHFGHLRTALDVMQGVGLAEVRFIPLHRAVHREQPMVSGRLRLRMLQLAVADQPGFVVDDRELRRRGDSYMVDTLASLRQEVGQRPLGLILGGDAFNHFLRWRQPQTILQLAHLVVMSRPGHDRIDDPQLRQLLNWHQATDRDVLHQLPAGRILFQPVTQLEISSTRIRGLLAAGHSPRYLLPEAVLHLLEADGLYRG